MPVDPQLLLFTRQGLRKVRKINTLRYSL